MSTQATLTIDSMAVLMQLVKQALLGIGAFLIMAPIALAIIVAVFQFLSDGRWWMVPAALILGAINEAWLSRQPNFRPPGADDGFLTRWFARLVGWVVLGTMSMAALYVAFSVLAVLLQPLHRPSSPPDDCPPGQYLNVDRECVSEPVTSETVPDGATARCNDGTYSFSRSRSGTCSQEGGVDVWDP